MRIFIGGAVAVLAIMAIGCGSSSGGGTTEAAVTAAQFIKRGDQICRKAEKEKERAIVAWREGEEKKGKGELTDYTPKELGQAYVSVALPPVKRAADELAALEAPAEGDEVEKFVKAMTSTVKAIEEEPIQGIKEAPFEDLDKVARASGFKVCGLF